MLRKSPAPSVLACFPGSPFGASLSVRVLPEMGTEPARWAHVSPASGPKNRLPRGEPASPALRGSGSTLPFPRSPRYTDPLLAEDSDDEWPAAGIRQRTHSCRSLPLRLQKSLIVDPAKRSRDIPQVQQGRNYDQRFAFGRKLLKGLTFRC